MTRTSTRWMRPLGGALAALAALALWAGGTMRPAMAADYPNRPVTLVVPIAVGGATDTLARMVAEHLQKTWGQSVVVESKPGASTMLGTQYVAKAAPDGYTLLIGLTNHLTNAVLNPKPGYDPLTSFEPVTQLVNAIGVVVVNPALPINNWADFVKYAKDRPGKVSHATNGNGSSSHFYAAMINDAAGIDMLIVPYKGESAALPELMGGNLDSVMISPGTYKSLAASKKVRGLATTGATRGMLFPDLPTLGEVGVPGPAQIGGWFGLFAPAGTPRDIVQKISGEVQAFLQQAPVRARIVNELGYEPVGSTPAQFADKLKKDYPAWQRAAKTYNIRLE